MPTLIQHVCLSCRKLFKKPTPYPSALSRGTAAREYACPQCGGALINMGHKFRAPAMTDAEEWGRIARCVADGVSYGTRTRRRPASKRPPVITPALKKVLGVNTKWKRRRKR